MSFFMGEGRKEPNISDQLLCAYIGCCRELPKTELNGEKAKTTCGRQPGWPSHGQELLLQEPPGYRAMF